MSTSRKPTASEELDHIEDALVEDLLDATGQELRDEIAAAETDPDACIAEIEKAITSARAECARRNLDNARAGLDVWRTKSRSAVDIERERAKARLERLRSSDSALDSKMTMAARKGEGLSERDLEGLIEDMAELERLEREEGGG